MELKDTIELMQSPDYKDRFRAEYLQVVIRVRKLQAMLDKWEDSSLDFKEIPQESPVFIQGRNAALKPRRYFFERQATNR